MDSIQTELGNFSVIETLRENAHGIDTLLVTRDKNNCNRYAILKRLTKHSAAGLASLQREMHCLEQLKHPRIPKLKCSNLSTHANHEDTVMLAMTYFSGLTLDKVIDCQGYISASLLYRWLEQACKLLCHLHEKGIIHQDIKPENIIIKNNKVHLIDFGGALLGTRPYAAPELMYESEDESPAGQHTPQTDLYALGRTFQHALFGSQWKDASSRERQQLKQTVAPGLIDFAEIVYGLTAEAPGDRPSSAQQVLAVLQRRKSVWQKAKDYRYWLPGAIALIAGASVVSLRMVGALQTVELRAYDHLMGTSAQLAPEPKDNRLAVITIDKADYDFQFNHPVPAFNPKGKTESDDSISDAALEQLLKRLLQDTTVQPSAIGLDLRRDKSVSSDYPFLKQIFQRTSQQQPLRLVCHVAGDSDASEPFGPPTDTLSDTEILTFSNLITAEGTVEGGTVRRATLAALHDSSVCPAYTSLALGIMTRYFTAKGMTADWTNNRFEITTGDRTAAERPTALPFLPEKLHVGGYRLSEDDGAGNQVLINYRRRRAGPTDLAPTFSLTEVLQGNYAPDAFANKVVLIGVDRMATSQKGDQHRVPYGGAPVPGVFIHAHIISQLISYIEDERRLMWALPQQTHDNSLIIVISLLAAGSLLALKQSQKGTLYAIAFCGGGILVLYVFSLCAFIKLSLWFPLVPVALAWSLTSVVVFAVHKYQEENSYMY